MKLQKPSILVVNWVSSCLSFLVLLHIFSLLLTVQLLYLVLKNLVHQMLNISISYWDLLKCLYFADTTERGDKGWKEAQRQGEDRVTLWISLFYPEERRLFGGMEYQKGHTFSIPFCLIEYFMSPGSILFNMGGVDSFFSWSARFESP